MWEHVREAGEFAFNNAIFVMAGVLLLGLCVAAVPERNPGWWLAYAPKGYRRGARRMRRERERHVNEIMTHEFVSCTEDRVINGEISRSEATEVYRKLKRLFPLRNLFPSSEWLKASIKNRLGKHSDVGVKLPADKKEAPRKRRTLLDPIPERVTL